MPLPFFTDCKGICLMKNKKYSPATPRDLHLPQWVSHLMNETPPAWACRRPAKEIHAGRGALKRGPGADEKVEPLYPALGSRLARLRAGCAHTSGSLPQPRSRPGTAASTPARARGECPRRPSQAASTTAGLGDGGVAERARVSSCPPGEEIATGGSWGTPRRPVTKS